MPKDSEKADNTPNLELPSLFGRGRKKKQKQQAAPAEETTTLPAVETDTESTRARPGPAPVEGSVRRLPPTPPPSSPAEVEDAAPVEATAPPVDPDVQPIPDPVPVPSPTPPVPAPEPVAPPTPTPDPGPIAPDPLPQPQPVSRPKPDPHPGPEFVEPVAARTAPEPPSTAAANPTSTALFVDEVQGNDPTSTAPAVQATEPVAPRTPRTPRTLPVIDPRLAAIVTGVVVGLIGVVLAWGAGQGCEAVRGVGSCGGTGLFALLAVLAIEILVGSTLLSAWRIPDSTSTSFLAVSLVAVVALLFFLSSLESSWMLLVIPALTAIAFLVSWWVTETFAEQGAGDSPHR